MDILVFTNCIRLTASLASEIHFEVSERLQEQADSIDQVVVWLRDVDGLSKQCELSIELKAEQSVRIVAVAQDVTEAVAAAAGDVKRFFPPSAAWQTCTAPASAHVGFDISLPVGRCGLGGSLRSLSNIEV